MKREAWSSRKTEIDWRGVLESSEMEQAKTSVPVSQNKVGGKNKTNTEGKMD